MLWRFLLWCNTFRKVTECHVLLTRFNDHVRAKDKLREGVGWGSRSESQVRRRLLLKCGRQRAELKPPTCLTLRGTAATLSYSTMATSPITAHSEAQGWLSEGMVQAP